MKKEKTVAKTVLDKERKHKEIENVL